MGTTEAPGQMKTPNNIAQPMASATRVKSCFRRRSAVGDDRGWNLQDVTGQCLLKWGT